MQRLFVAIGNTFAQAPKEGKQGRAGKGKQGQGREGKGRKGQGREGKGKKGQGRVGKGKAVCMVTPWCLAPGQP